MDTGEPSFIHTRSPVSLPGIGGGVLAAMAAYCPSMSPGLSHIHELHARLQSTFLPLGVQVKTDDYRDINIPITFQYSEDRTGRTRQISEWKPSTA